ncbi:hypothetical protein [Thermochromatium tepidum]|uniref:hypothetical protein n=1 Tax=Thermochromatium tepidum TaxID=1050 RepID=UPI003CCCE9B3
MERLPRSVRAWVCPVCGTSQDRDLKAARNPLPDGLAVPTAPPARFAGRHARGVEGAGRCRKTTAKPASVKQDVRFVYA